MEKCSPRFEVWKKGFDKLIECSESTEEESTATGHVGNQETGSENGAGAGTITSSEPTLQCSEPEAACPSADSETCEAHIQVLTDAGATSSSSTSINPIRPRGPASRSVVQSMDCRVLKWMQDQAKSAQTGMFKSNVYLEGEKLTEILENIKTDILEVSKTIKFEDELSPKKMKTFEIWWKHVYARNIQYENKTRRCQAQHMQWVFKMTLKRTKGSGNPTADPDVLDLMEDQWIQYYKSLKTKNMQANRDLLAFVASYRKKMYGLMKENICNWNSDLKDWHDQVLEHLPPVNFQQYTDCLNPEKMEAKKLKRIQNERTHLIAKNEKKVEEELNCVKGAVDYVIECYKARMQLDTINSNPMHTIALEILHLEVESRLLKAFGDVVGFKYTEAWELDRCELPLRLTEAFELVESCNMEASKKLSLKLEALRKGKRSSDASSSSSKRARSEAPLETSTAGTETVMNNVPSEVTPALGENIASNQETISVCESRDCPRWNSFSNFNNVPCNHCKSQKRSGGGMGFIFDSTLTNAYCQLEWEEPFLIEPVVTFDNIAGGSDSPAVTADCKLQQILDSTEKLTITAALEDGQEEIALYREEIFAIAVGDLQKRVKDAFGPEGCESKLAVMVPNGLGSVCRQQLKTGLKLAGFLDPVLVQHTTAIGLCYSAYEIKTLQEQHLVIIFYLSNSMIETSVALVSHIEAVPFSCQVIATTGKFIERSMTVEMLVAEGFEAVERVREGKELPKRGGYQGQLSDWTMQGYVFVDARNKAKNFTDPSRWGDFLKVLTDNRHDSTKKINMDQDCILKGLILASKGAKYQEVFPWTIIAELGVQTLPWLSLRNENATKSIVRSGKCFGWKDKRPTTPTKSGSQPAKHTIIIRRYYLQKMYKQEYAVQQSESSFDNIEFIVEGDGCLAVKFYQGQSVANGWKANFDLLEIRDEEELKKYQDRIRKLRSLPTTKVTYKQD